MPQNARVTVFTVSELLRENQEAGEGGGDSKTAMATKKVLRAYLFDFASIFQILLK